MRRDIETTNEELMLRVQKGNLAAFEALYERFHKQLYSFIFRFVKERTLAEDILQETFLRILRDRKTYRKSSHFLAYLFTIGRNLCLDALKKWEKKHVISNQQDYLKTARDIKKGPLDIMEDAEISKTLQKEIDSLPPDQREILVLSKYSGLTYEEIAQIVGSTSTAVKQKAYRALLSLRQKLEKLRD